jgi:hypothetical protein
VQSLIYAAARFSEFPELRDLRSVFINRYGPPLEALVNKEVITDSSSSLFTNKSYRPGPIYWDHLGFCTDVADY